MLTTSHFSAGNNRARYSVDYLRISMVTYA